MLGEGEEREDRVDDLDDHEGHDQVHAGRAENLSPSELLEELRDPLHDALSHLVPDAESASPEGL